MATPNNVTPTNCSWWPISALENNAGKSTEGEENHDPTDPALKSQDRLVLYHWTQSFSSQKVKKTIARPGSRARITSSSQGVPLPREDGCTRGRARGSAPGQQRAARQIVVPFNSICLGRDGDRDGDEHGGAQPNLAFALGSRLAPGAASALCSLPAPHRRGRQRRQRQSRARDHPAAARGEAAPGQAGARERIPDPSTQR